MNIEIVSIIAITLSTIAGALSFFAFILFQWERKKEQQHLSSEKSESQVRNEKNVVVRKDDKATKINHGSSPGFQGT